jgi:hypothetical protein
MEIASILTIMLLGGLLLIYQGIRSKERSKSGEKIDELQKQIETALNLPSESAQAWQNEPATDAMLSDLKTQGISINHSFTKGQAMNVLGLFSPPDGRQVDILKYFNIPYSFKMNQTMAHYVIRELFNDPQKVAEWNNRPPTTTVRQGLLFMEGKLTNGLNHVESQAKLDRIGMKNPELYREWKQIDRLFLEANNPEVRGKFQVRKITWKRFFESYDALKATGTNPFEMRGEDIITQTFHNDSKIAVHTEIRDLTQPLSS